MSARREYIDLVLKTARNPDAGVPVDFDAILTNAGMTRADFIGHTEMIREVSDELAREPESTAATATECERFPTGQNAYKTRII